MKEPAGYFSIQVYVSNQTWGGSMDAVKDVDSLGVCSHIPTLKNVDRETDARMLVLLAPRP